MLASKLTSKNVQSLLNAISVVALACLFIYIQVETDPLKSWIAFGVAMALLIKISVADGTFKLIQDAISSKRKAFAKNKKPSQLSFLFAGLLHDAENREFSLGCLEERFGKDVIKRGRFYANCMLWRDNFGTFWSRFGAKAIKFSKWIGLSYLFKELASYLFHYFQN